MRRILLETTIPSAADDWHVGRFGVLRATLEQVSGADGRPLFAVEARDRVEDSRGEDVDLAALPDSPFDQLWLLAVEANRGLSVRDAASIDAFRLEAPGTRLRRDVDARAWCCGWRP